MIPEAADNERRSRLDPVLPGVSVGHIASTAGTFGCVVYDTSGAEPADAPLMLSNWHVLHGDSGALGDVVVQPGPYDDPAVEKNHVGTLLRSHLGIEGDCAVARIEGVMTACPSRSDCAMPASGNMSARQTSICFT